MAFSWDFYTGNLRWLPERTFYVTRHGSHAYGTSLPTSDLDLRGVCIAPKEYYLGFGQVFEQAEQKEPDLVVFELRKFMKLAADANPNVLELLHTDESDHVVTSPIFQKLAEHRHLFLSRKAKHTFSGYAVSQLKRINTHYRWLKTPPQGAPTRAEFELPERTVIPADQLAAANAAIQKQVDAWSWHGLEDVDPATRQAIQDEFSRRLAEITSWGWEETTEKTWLAASRAVGFDTNFIELLDRERRYTGKLREWQQYNDWKKNRNVDRAALEEKYGYDCYLDDTEFLTAQGWKRYDEISNEQRLATLNQNTGVIEYQSATERVSKQYNGPICFFETQDTACAVTPNHRMWVSEVRGGRANVTGTAYNESKADWKILSAEKMLAGRRYSYHVRTAGEGSVLTKDEHTLIMVGAYVSEGCVGHRLKDGTPSVLRFSQKKGGRQEPYLERLLAERTDVQKFLVPRNEKGRKKPIIENVYTVADRDLAKTIARDCGEGSKSKRLPPWTRALAKKDARFLLDVLVSGDGTNRKFSRIYYTSSKTLAEDVQILAVVAGFTSMVWGPYPDNRRPDTSMYHVYIGRGAFSRVITKGKDSHVKVENVTGRHIVCFTVPNEVLITRRNGKVAIQGNTKHGMHLVRLLRMCREILTEGKVLVRRPDAEELLRIRAGEWDYHKLVEWAEAQDKDLEALSKTSKLPNQPDRKKLDQLCIELVEASFR